MQQPPHRTPLPAPKFYVTARQPVRPAAVLLALLIFAGGALLVGFGVSHSRKMHRNKGTMTGDTSPGDNDEKDDPSQVDTIVLGDPADAPVPARKGRHTSSVHPTILIRLPRFGPQVGLLPSSPAGHLLYGWLAAFNQANPSALARALPNGSPDSTVAAQMELRRQTGGFNLLSAAEPAPGLLVFRLRDQTPAGGEALGTLQVSPNSNPPTVASFSLRAVAP